MTDSERAYALLVERLTWIQGLVKPKPEQPMTTVESDRK